MTISYFCHDAKGKGGRDDAVLSSAYPVHGSASEVNRLGADVQVVSCRRYLVFHPYDEQLTVFYISGLVLALTSVLRVLYLNVAVARDSILSGTCLKGS